MLWNLKIPGQEEAVPDKKCLLFFISAHLLKK